MPGLDPGRVACLAGGFAERYPGGRQDEDLETTAAKPLFDMVVAADAGGGKGGYLMGSG